MKLLPLVVLAGISLPLFGADHEGLMGYDAESAGKQRALEKRFDANLKREDLRNWMQRLTAHPHHLGSPYDKQNAEFIAAQFRSWGYETEIEQFDVLFPTPKTRALEMTAPESFKASLCEPALKEDSTSSLTAEQLPVYNAYSIDGDVSGKLVYVNYGVPKDYEMLAERGIDVKGCIVIARYGGSWRGIKPKVAAEHGAVGCLIYSDPRDDGYFQGDVYPQGAWRNENGAQRGSVADMPLYSGDPLTPGVGATKDAHRLAIKDAPTLTKIPVLPISYADATPLLRAMTGPVAPEAWRGALPLTYHLGPGNAKVHLKLEFNWDLVPAYDVIAKMPGTERPDEWIIRGNHHDAWVCGADDPVSGTVALMEEARALSELARGGWKPRRAVVFTVWDGEEPGLLGSTEWAETHADLLKRNAAVYVNSDSNQRGFLHIGGSHTLEKFANEIARDVVDPEKHISVSARTRAERLVKAVQAERREISERKDLRIDALGSGSDYTPFLQHLGIASLNFGYSGEGSGGSYHSVYDSFDHFTRFCDPDFDYGLALAQTAGRAVLRLANADTLPFETSAFAETVEKYSGEVIKLADDMREETKQMNRLIREKLLDAAADPRQPFVAPKPKSDVPFLDFAPLQNAVAGLKKSSGQFEAARQKLAPHEAAFSRKDQQALDELLMNLEHLLTSPEGLPRRPWYQHLIYAPGFYTGYGVKTLPGVREAIEERDWPEATRQIGAAAKAIQRFAQGVDTAAALLNPSAAVQTKIED